MLVEKLSDIWVSWVSFRVFTIQRSYETPRQGRTSPAGTHVMLGGLLCPRGGLGIDAAVEGLFMPTWCCCCGELMLLWDGSDETERWKLAVLDIKKLSPMDSVFKAGNRVQSPKTWHTPSQDRSFLSIYNLIKSNYMRML